MTDINALKLAIKDSGLSMTKIAEKTGIMRATLYNRLNGIGEFTASEIVALTKCLNLERKARDEIFLSEKLN